MSMAAVARAATMAPGRAAARFMQTRLRSSGGNVLGEEEKAAENVYIKMTNRKGLMDAILARFLFIPAFYFMAKYGDQGYMIFLTNQIRTTCS